MPASLWLACAAPLALLLVPLLALTWRGFDGVQWSRAVADPIVRQALGLSLGTTSLTLVLVVLLGTPLAYLLARHQFPGRTLLDSLVDLPMILPPAVAGLALLMAFGRRGLIGAWLDDRGFSIAFSTAAVIMAQCFVALPFYVRSARAGFEGVERELEDVARTLGAGPWRVMRSITLPLAAPSLLVGAVLAWARALGEFGATLMFAGNFPGRTQTMPLAVYTAMESDLGSALTLALLLLAVSLAALVALRLGHNGTLRPR